MSPPLIIDIPGNRPPTGDQLSVSTEDNFTPGFGREDFPEAGRQAIADAGYDADYVIANDTEIDLETPLEEREAQAEQLLKGLTENERALFIDSARAMMPVFQEAPRRFQSSQTGTGEPASYLGAATKKSVETTADAIEAEQAQPVNDLEAAQYGLELITRFNFRDIDLVRLAHRMSDEDVTPKQKLAFHFLQQMYEKKDITWDGLLRATGNLLLSPSTYVGVGSFGIATAAAQAAKTAGKEGIKAYIRSQIPNAVALGVEGGAYASLDNAMKQSVENTAADANPEIAEGLGMESEFGLGENLAHTALGTALGGTVGMFGNKVIDKAGEFLEGMVQGAKGGNTLGSGLVPPSDRSLVELLRGESASEDLLGAIDQLRALPTTAAANATKRGTYQTYLTVDSPLENPTGGVVKKVNPRNADRVFTALDENHARHPSPLASPDEFAAYFSDAMGTNFSIIPPYQAIKYVNDPSYLRETMSRMGPEQIRLADDGFKIADQIKQLYSSKTASVEDTAELFLWGILSRMKSAFPHESAFLDAVTHADASGKTFQDFAADFIAGRGNVDDFLSWAGGVYPKASPGRAASENLNAFAKTFLPKMTTPMADGRMPLQVLHDLISDPNMSGQQIRREFYKVAEGVGIDNKVLSFILLLTGRNDVMVFDRIQFNHLFNDGRFGDFNIYQGASLPKADRQGNPAMKATGAPDLTLAPGSSIQEAGSSAQGLVLYEAVENELAKVLPGVYQQLGRPYRGLGQFHWESWVLTSGQEVGHGSLSYFPAKMAGLPTPTKGARAIEGRYHKYQYGAEYGRNDNGDPVVDFTLPNGTSVEFTPESFSEFAKRLNKPGEGVIPGDFNVSEFENATKAWVNDPRVNQEAIIRIADDFVKSGRASVDATAGNAAGTGYSAGREVVRGFRRRIAIRSHTGDIGGASGPYEAKIRKNDGGNGLLEFTAKKGKAVGELTKEVNLPKITQVGADAAQKYFDDMTAAMSRNEFGAQVEIKSVDDLKNLKLFRTEGGGGFVLKPDSDIVAVFASGAEPRSGYAVLSAAVQAGGKKLDAFDTFLPKIYSAAGFKIVARMKFSDEFAPAPPEAIRKWDKKTFKEFNNGEPDIVFMVHDPDYFGPPTGGRYFDSYDEAVAAQDAELARIYPPNPKEE